jgi:molecular chaperone GrpE
MADKQNPPTGPSDADDDQEPIIRDKRRIDPETGDVREPGPTEAGAPGPTSEDVPDETDDLSEADQALLDRAGKDLIAEMRSDMLRAQAELVNFRTRVERDRVANRDAVIAEVIRSLLPALDDLSRAEAHGDLVEGAPMTIVAQKLRGAFEKYGLRQIGEKGEPFDPAFHEAVVQLPSPDVTVNTIADVIEPGYVLGDRLVRPAKVAVSVPAE